MHEKRCAGQHYKRRTLQPYAKNQPKKRSEQMRERGE
jgi:hypothetical protein